MTASFGSITFHERGTPDGLHYPVRDRRAILTAHRFPGGSRVVVQAYPDSLHTLQTTAYTDLAGYQALVAAVGSLAQLTLAYDSGLARLMAVRNARHIAASGKFFVDLTFLLPGAYTPVITNSAMGLTTNSGTPVTMNPP